MWHLKIKITGSIGFADGHVKLKEGVLITPEEELTEAQKQKLETSKFWHKESPVVEEEQTLEESDKQPVKKRKGRKPANKKV